MVLCTEMSLQALQMYDMTFITIVIQPYQIVRRFYVRRFPWILKLLCMAIRYCTRTLCLESVPYVSPTLTSCDKYMCGWMDGHLPIHAKGCKERTTQSHHPSVVCKYAHTISKCNFLNKTLYVDAQIATHTSGPYEARGLRLNYLPISLSNKAALSWRDSIQGQCYSLYYNDTILSSRYHTSRDLTFKYLYSGNVRVVTASKSAGITQFSLSAQLTPVVQQLTHSSDKLIQRHSLKYLHPGYLHLNH